MEILVGFKARGTVIWSALQYAMKEACAKQLLNQTSYDCCLLW